MDLLVDLLEAVAFLWRACRKTISEFNWGRRGGDGDDPPSRNSR